MACGDKMTLMDDHDEVQGIFICELAVAHEGMHQKSAGPDKDNPEVVIKWKRPLQVSVKALTE